MRSVKAKLGAPASWRHRIDPQPAEREPACHDGPAAYNRHVLRATAIAHPNIALVKYWGKRDDATNLPATGSLSITLGALTSRTVVEFDPARSADTLILDGREDPAALGRVTACLEVLRRQAGVRHGALVRSDNDFPTGAGLASSASGSAALAVAAAAALGIDAAADLATVARLGSGSAPRSLHGGFVVLRNAGAGVRCEPCLEASAWPLTTLIAVVSEAPKDVSSRAGMALSRATSPFYAAWVGGHEADLADALAAVRARDFGRLAAVAEHNCLKMHAVMLTTRPPLLYWMPATLACIGVVRALRDRGTPVFFTIDAGPQVKAICPPEAAATVRAALAAVPGVVRVLQSGLGGPARVVDG
jgi:diphosphomevalonate decarboxylase